MAKEFRYSLTRICLRTGQLSLSNRMAQLFPDSGSVTVHDTAEDVQLELEATAPRVVTGVAEFIEKHDLGVNDAIVIRETEDGKITFTPQRRKRQTPVFDREVIVAHLLEELGSGGPRSEEEIRALDSRIPDDFPLNDLLDSHPRFAMRAGRWQVVEGIEDADAGAPGWEAPAGRDQAGWREQVAGDPGAGDQLAGEQVAGEQVSTESVSSEPMSRQSASDEPASSEPASSEPEGREPVSGVDQPGFADLMTQSAAPPTSRPADEEAQPIGDESGIDDSIWPDSLAQPESSHQSDEYEPLLGERHAGSRGTGSQADRVSVTPYPRNVMFPGEAALNSKRDAVDLAASKRAREALTEFGYRVEGLPHGMLLARADLGRRQQAILVRALADKEKLDWAALLAARREYDAPYLAVMGDHRDLHRLSAPAELARATLWSWDGVERARNLSARVPLGPFDLEPHFESGGLFGSGLEEFERRVGQMIEERGRISALLSELARFPTPSVFVLDDLVGGELRRDQLAGMLESLSGPPFHLVSRIDKGEYCLRQSVDSALLQVSEYALSLRDRLSDGGGGGDGATTTEADAPPASARERRR